MGLTTLSQAGISIMALMLLQWVGMLTPEPSPGPVRPACDFNIVRMSPALSSGRRARNRLRMRSGPVR